MSFPEINPAWVDAPYTIDFMIGVPIPLPILRQWSRKRRLKWIRRKMRPYACKNFLPGLLPNPVFDRCEWNSPDWDQPVEKCPCDGDYFFLGGHRANCEFAPGN